MANPIKIKLPLIREVWKEIDSANMKFVKLLDSDGNVLVGSPINQDVKAAQKNIEKLLHLHSTADGEYLIECRQTTRTAKRTYCIVKGDGEGKSTTITPLASNLEPTEWQSNIQLERQINSLILEKEILEAENKQLLIRVQELEQELEEMPEQSLNDAPSATQKLLDSITPVAAEYLPMLLDGILAKWLPKPAAAPAPTFTAPRPGQTNPASGITRFSPEYYEYLRSTMNIQPEYFNNEMQYIATHYPDRVEEVSKQFGGNGN
jgi:hypothetical protein